MGSVYIIHLHQPLKHARHYIGYSDFLARRLWHHQNGTGARFMRAVKEAGITWEVGSVYPECDRAFERKLKRCKNGPRFCTICQGKREVRV